VMWPMTFAAAGAGMTYFSLRIKREIEDSRERMRDPAYRALLVRCGLLSPDS
jgi:hypothetical protein